MENISSLTGLWLREDSSFYQYAAPNGAKKEYDNFEFNTPDFELLRFIRVLSERIISFVK